LGWEKVSEKKSKAIPQKQLFIELSTEEKQVIDAFKGEENIAVDELSLKASLPISKTTSILLNLEFKGVIRSLPGKMYQRI